MKRFVLLLVAVLMILPSAEAKRRETPEEIERKTRHYSGWEWGAEGRFNLVFYDMDYQKVFNESPVKSYRAWAKFGGNFMLNGGYFINNNWKVGLELGAQIQYNYTVMPVAVTARYFYGKRKNCLFNFVNVGTNMLFKNGVRFGALGEGGVGVRLQSPDSKFKYDIIIGYQAIMMNPKPQGGEFQFNAKDINYKKVNQSVYIGLGINF
ncbi:MAG: hypothetical protein IJE99_04965 [Alistipes sp.]|nr:hypothetical protein [Alistipes sp.]